MRARILVTNGQRTVDLFWLSHDGKDVYCGFTKSDHKRSFHESGKIHTTSNGKRQDEAWVAPLAELKGQFNLGSLSFGDAKKMLEIADPRYDYHCGKSDAVVVVDARSIPDGCQANLSYGLLEPGNFEALAPFIKDHHVPGFISLSCEQLVLATSVEPWVYVILHWWKDAT
jgi:hypothetical protein